MPKYYFQAPNLNIYLTDPNVPKIGSIYPNLKTLASALNPSQIPFIPSSSIKTYTEHHFSDARGTTLDVSGGVNVSDATGALGAADLIYAYSSTSQATYSCDILETSEFIDGEPTPGFVQQSIDAAPDVQAFIEHTLFRNKKVYMITGLKVAANLRVKTQTSRKQGPGIKLTFNATPLGVPLSGGPQADASFGKTRDWTYEKAGAVVFAYRVVKITRKRDGDVTSKQVGGGMYGVDQGEEEKAQWAFEDATEEILRTQFPNAAPITVERQQGVAVEEEAETVDVKTD